MTIFVLGILVGWVLEYVAFNFWWKDKLNPRGGSSERTEYEARLAAKDREIAQLQQKLLSAGSETKDSDVPNKATPAPKAAAAKSEQPAAKKAAPKKKAAATKKSAKKAVGVPLDNISGIGPITNDALKAAGLGDAATLAAAKEDDVKAALEKAGARAGNIASWIEQAKLLAAGDMDALAKLKESL